VFLVVSSVESYGLAASGDDPGRYQKRIANERTLKIRRKTIM